MPIETALAPNPHPAPSGNVNEQLLAAGARRRSWKARYRRRVMVLDVAIVVGAVVIAQLVRFGIPTFAEDTRVNIATLVVSGYSIALAAFWSIVLGLQGSRDLSGSNRGFEEFRTVISATMWVFGAIALLGLLFNQQMARGYLAIVLPVGLAGLLTGRLLWRKYLGRVRERGAYTQQLVVVGNPGSVVTLCRCLSRQKSAGYRVLGACVPGSQDLGQTIQTALGQVPILGSESSLENVLIHTNADAVAIAAAEQLGDARMKQLAWHLEALDTDLIVVPGMTDIAGPRLRVQPIDNLPLFYISHARRSVSSYYLKRIFDLVLATLAFLAFLPLMIAIAVAVRLDDGGPALFRQERVGYQGRLFRIMKFRTMTADADQRIAEERAVSGQIDSVFYKSATDSRLTKVGAFLRKTSLDELPQLLNVIGGSMSVVGPRPLVMGEGESVERFLERRSLVKPGITGLWQVSGRSELSPEERVRLDHSYVDNWSFAQDVVIVLRTIAAVVKREGAY